MTDFSGLNYEQLDDDTTPEGHKSGFVAVIGRPNVGKSTLINHLLRQKIAIVSPKAQTTRVQQLGILSQDNAQIIFVDTPGLHKPQHKLGDFMVGIAQQALRDADVILFLVEVNALPGAGDRIIATQIKQAAAETPVLLALNKADLADADSLQRHVDAYTTLVEPNAWQAISALQGDGVDALLAQIITLLPEGPRFYPPDMITEANMRNLAAEMVREQVFLLTHEEVPHAAAVEVDEYVERSETQAYIRATIYVERDSHKSILIGKNGQMLKQIGQAARAEIERLAGINVYLDLWVKVLKNWRKDERMLRRFGYRLGK